MKMTLSKFFEMLDEFKIMCEQEPTQEHGKCNRAQLRRRQRCWERLQRKYAEEEYETRQEEK